MGQALLLASARVVPRRLERAGFRFQHPGLEAALRAALASQRPRSASA
jgi:NAD dependent epimerase/dehydratase family enzyme